MKASAPSSKPMESGTSPCTSLRQTETCGAERLASRDVTLPEILDEIQDKLPTAYDCSKMNKSNDRYPYFIVKFPSAAPPKFTIYWEKFRPVNRTTQCYNGSRNCNMTPKCLKCGEDHKTNDCKKPREQPPKCANCEGEHLSNSRHCTAYKSYIKRIGTKKDPPSPRITEPARRTPDPAHFPALPPGLPQRSRAQWGPIGAERRREPDAQAAGRQHKSYRRPQHNIAEALAANYERVHKITTGWTDPTTETLVHGSVSRVTATVNSDEDYEDVYTTCTEVKEIVSKLKNAKAPGENEIQGRILKKLPDKVLEDILNSCIRNDYFPSTWKNANVIPIHKANKDPHLATSYGPISLLPILGVRSALYADDTAIYVLGGPHAGLRLQHQLDKLEPYYRKWKIKINAEKTERYNGAHKTKVPTLYNSTYKVMGKLPSEPAEPAPDFLRIQQSLIQEARQLVAQPEEEEELSEP
ncbi:hypothetical protein WDU94_007426 [Cyamophila willieti]